MSPTLHTIQVYNISDNRGIWSIVSEILGWSYFFVWSVSFYPQVYMNWKRKSVRGLSIDFLCYNVLGFFCYSIYNLSFYFNKEIRDEYHQRHPLSDHSLVRMNDVVFSIHAFIMSLFILLQTCIYKKYESQRISSFAASFIWLSVMGSTLVISTIHYGGANWIDFMYYLSFINLTVSFIKYLPQVWVNYKRRSTQGWSIQFIIWDFSGGILSIMQLLLDAYVENDWSGVEGDNLKLGLGIIVAGFDLLFMVQHYVLYPKDNYHSSQGDQSATYYEEILSVSNEYDHLPANESSSRVKTIDRRPMNANKHYGSTKSVSVV